MKLLNKRVAKLTGKVKRLAASLIMLVYIFCMCRLSVYAKKSPDAAKANDAQTEAIVLSAESATQLSASVSKQGCLRISGTSYSAGWDFYVPADSSYGISLEYAKNSGCTADLYVNVSIDGEAAVPNAEKVLLPGFWEDEGNIHTDLSGNEFAPDQREIFGSFHKWSLLDTESGGGKPLEILLVAGKHTLTLSGGEADFSLKAVTLFGIFDTSDYTDVSREYVSKGYRPYNGDEIVIEGESATEKTSKSLIPLSDSSDASVSPADPYSGKLNYIGGSNWKMSGETIYWEVDAPATGLYQLAIYYRQNYLMNSTSYRRLTVDGSVPFKQAEAISFKYTSKWKMQTLSDNNSEPCLIYLTKGKHTIALSVTLGEMTEFAERLKGLTLSLGSVYREIVMITGETPDPNRDYNLFGHIPQLEDRLIAMTEEIDWLIAETQRVNGSRGDSNSAILNKMKVIIEQMLKQRYTAQKKKNAFYDSYSSLSAYLYEMQNMALDIDSLVLAAPDSEYQRGNGGFLAQTVFSAKRFASSFIKDYSAVSGEETKESITLWINWSREQAMALSKRVSSSFTPQTGIPVNIRLTNASLLQAILSGNGPDCALSVQRTLPVNLAMRGALCDLSGFSDYGETVTHFMESAMVPYRYGNGVYALPSTQQFYMMFCRTDIFEELELEPPETWDDFIEISSVLMMNNMQVGLPYTEITDISQTDSGVGALSIFPTLLLQSGVDLYFSRDEIVTYIYEMISRILSENDISYVKWDMNRTMSEYFSSSLSAECQGELMHRYILGVYSLAERLTSAFPQVFFEGCAGGGGRFDAGMLYYFPQIWTSDDTDGLERTKIQWGTSLAYPLSAMSCHVSACPNHQTQRITPFETRGAVASLGATGYELDPGALNNEEREAVKKQIKEYKRIGKLILKGDLYRLSNPFKENYFCEMAVSKDKTRAYAVGEQFRATPDNKKRFLRLYGLDPQKTYRIEELQLSASGAVLMNCGIMLPHLHDCESFVWHIEAEA